MGAVPQWVLGKHVSAYVLTGMTPGADGTLTAATGAGAQPMAGLWDEIELESDPTLEEISASDSSRRNNVIVQEGTRVRMSAILRKAKGPGAGATDATNPLAALATTYDYIQVAITRGGNSWTFVGVRGQFSERIGKNRGSQSLTLEMCDPGTVNPTYA